MPLPSPSPQGLGVSRAYTKLHSSSTYTWLLRTGGSAVRQGRVIFSGRTIARGPRTFGRQVLTPGSWRTGRRTAWQQRWGRAAGQVGSGRGGRRHGRQAESPNQAAHQEQCQAVALTLLAEASARWSFRFLIGPSPVTMACRDKVAIRERGWVGWAAAGAGAASTLALHRS